MTCTQALAITLLTALGVALRLAALRNKGVRLTLPATRRNGHKPVEALYKTEKEDYLEA